MRPISARRFATSGRTSWPASGSDLGPLPRDTTTARMTATIVTPKSQAKPLSRISLPSRNRADMARPSPQAHDANDDRRDSDQDWHGGDVEELGQRLEPIDVLAQCELDLTQLLANADHVG